MVLMNECIEDEVSPWGQSCHPALNLRGQESSMSIEVTAEFIREDGSAPAQEAAEAGCLMIRCRGDVPNYEGEKALADRCYEEIKKHSPARVLIDLQGIIYQSGITDKSRAVEYYQSTFPAEIRRIKIAIVAKHRYFTLLKFWENYAHNRGYDWPVFTDMNDAFTYLSPD